MQPSTSRAPSEALMLRTLASVASAASMRSSASSTVPLEVLLPEACWEAVAVAAAPPAAAHVAPAAQRPRALSIAASLHGAAVDLAAAVGAGASNSSSGGDATAEALASRAENAPTGHRCSESTDGAENASDGHTVLMHTARGSAHGSAALGARGASTAGDYATPDGVPASPFEGWFHRCRGCGWPTAYEQAVPGAVSAVSICRRCDATLRSATPELQARLCARLAHVHNAWAAAGI